MFLYMHCIHIVGFALHLLTLLPTVLCLMMRYFSHPQCTSTVSCIIALSQVEVEDAMFQSALEASLADSHVDDNSRLVAVMYVMLYILITIPISLGICQESKLHPLQMLLGLCNQ